MFQDRFAAAPVYATRSIEKDEELLYVYEWEDNLRRYRVDRDAVAPPPKKNPRRMVPTLISKEVRSV